jgi:aspartyl-tRNA(Asn)/glutamyl-tRNA(Gln) amidotransferase subunit A
VISRWGVIPYANSLDTVGIIACTAKDINSIFKRCEGHDARDPTSLADTTRLRIGLREEQQHDNESIDFTGTRIGVPLEYNISELDPIVRDAWVRALKMLRRAGATIVPISLPNTKHALSAYYVLAPAEAASNLAKYDGVRYGYREQGLPDGANGDVLYSRTRGNGFGKEVRRRILLGSYTLSSEAIDNYFIKAQKVRRLVQRDFDRVFALGNPLRPAEQFDLSDMDESILLDSKLGPPQVDFIISPTAPTLPPKVETILEQTPVDTYMNDVFTVPASLAGIPAISIPFPLHRKDMVPHRCNHVGIQIMGQFYDDKRVLSIATKFQDLIERNGILAR